MKLTLIPNDHIDFDVPIITTEQEQIWENSLCQPLRLLSPTRKGDWGRQLVQKAIQWHGVKAERRHDRGDITAPPSSIVEVKLTMQGSGGKFWWNTISFNQGGWTDLGLVMVQPERIRVFLLTRLQAMQMMKDDNNLTSAGQFARVDINTIMEIKFWLRTIDESIKELQKYSTLILDCHPSLVIK